jgi:hypothetical protein
VAVREDNPDYEQTGHSYSSLKDYLEIALKINKDNIMNTLQKFVVHQERKLDIQLNDTYCNKSRQIFFAAILNTPTQLAQ